MPKKNGLGRGLDALFSDNAVDENRIEVALTELEPNQNQPRRQFNEAALAELSDSIATHGMLQPILVRPMPGGRYQIVAGERRWRAARLAGLSVVPVFVRELSDHETAELALIENLQREDLNAIEEAAGYHSLMNQFSMTQDEVATRVGKSRPAVANALRLLQLDDATLDLVRNNAITAGHARALLAFADESARQAAALLAAQGASVRELERMAKQAGQKKAAPRTAAETPRFLREVELSLTETLGRKIKVSGNGQGGQLTVEFFDEQDLAQLAHSLAGKDE